LPGEDVIESAGASQRGDKLRSGCQHVYVEARWGAIVEIPRMTGVAR